MISRQHRFHGHNSLSFVYKNGRVVRGPLFSIKYTKNSKRADYRAAVVVSKKVDKSAVIRNRIRRRMFEALRAQEKNIIEHFDIVITVFSVSVAEMPQKELEAGLNKLLIESGITVKRV